MAVPTGFASTGLPLSMQIIGKPFDEKTVYRVARAYEKATDWTFKHPDLDEWKERFSLTSNNDQTYPYRKIRKQSKSVDIICESM